AEDGGEVDLAVAKRPEAPRTIDPVLIAAIDARAATRPILGILHVKRPHALVIDVEEGKVVELLQDHVAWVVENIRAGVPANRVEKALEGHAVMEVLARVKLETGVDTCLVEGVENRRPAAAEFGERFVDEP